MFHNLAGRIVTFTSVEFSGMIVAQNDQYLGLNAIFLKTLNSWPSLFMLHAILLLVDCYGLNFQTPWM